jgi:hypothetical protein
MLTDQLWHHDGSADAAQIHQLMIDQNILTSVMASWEKWRQNSNTPTDYLSEDSWQISCGLMIEVKTELKYTSSVLPVQV